MVLALRAERGQTRAALARRSGLHVTHLARIEAGTRDPRLTTIVKLARGLGMTAPELVREFERGYD